MGLRLSIVGGTLVARSARAFMRPVARRAITTKRTDWAGEARSVCQGATEDKLEALGYALPPASTPKGSYAMYSRAGDMLFLAGHIPVRPDGSICTGVVGRDLKKAQGTDAARLCGLAILRTLSDAVGLDNVKQVHNCVEINQCIGCTRQFFTKSFLGDDAAVMTPLSGEEPHRHAIGQALRRWRGGRRLDSARTRRKILISTQVHKLVAFVACSDDFENQPGVVNGCSDLLFEVLGDRGVHARSAVGTNALPLGVPVEIEAIVEVEAGS